MTLLANVQTTATEIPAPVVDTTMTVLPPGFDARPSRPIVYIGGEMEGGQPFYTWNHDSSSREYVPTSRFSARMTDIKLIVKNPDDAMKRSVKLVCEFITSSGGEVAVSCGANTYSAMGIIAGLSALTGDQLTRELGLSGKVGKSGKVTFVSVFSDGKLSRNPDSEDLLKEARGTDAYMAAVEGYVADIKDRLG